LRGVVDSIGEHSGLIRGRNMSESCRLIVVLVRLASRVDNLRWESGLSKAGQVPGSGVVLRDPVG